jgi:hypothetical protein
MRDKMDKTQMSYDDIEKVAVKAGVPPTGLGSLDIPRGLWSYIGNGFYIRVYPRNYTTTDLEIYRPGVFTVKKDDKGRIISYARAGEEVTIEYDDTPGADLFTSEGHPSIPIWRFKHVVYTNKEKGSTQEISNKGWVLRGPLSNMSAAFVAKNSAAKNTATRQPGAPWFAEDEAAASDQSAAPDQRQPNIPGPTQALAQPKQKINWDEVYERYKTAKERADQADEAVEWAKRIDEANKLQNYDEYLNEKAAEERIAAALKAASDPTDFKGKADWIYDLIKMDRDLMYWIDCRLAGKCSDSNDPTSPDLPSKVGQPGNSGAQRLGLSPYVKK